MSIECDPEILGGKPIVKGTRVPVDLILELVGLGYSIDRIVEEYPHLSKRQVQRLLKFVKRLHEVAPYEKIRAVVEA
mgnify:CR=1 FL=1